MINFEIIIKIISSSIVIGLISLFFRLGEWSQIAGSKFIEKNDDKDKLLRDAKSNIFSYKDNFIRSIILVFPYILFQIILYLVVQLVADKLPNITQFYNIGISTYFLPAILFVLFQAGYMFFAMNFNRISINSESRINYNHPSWYYYIHLLVYSLIILLDVFVRPELKGFILSWLQIDNERNIKISIYYLIFAFVSHFLIIKPLTRNIIQIDHNLYIESLKLSQKRQHTVIGVLGFVFSIITILIIILIFVSSVGGGIILPIGDLINIYCFILIGAVLSGQRSKYFEITKNYLYKKNKLYYKNSSGKEIKLQ